MLQLAKWQIHGTRHMTGAQPGTGFGLLPLEAGFATGIQHGAAATDQLCGHCIGIAEEAGLQLGDEVALCALIGVLWLGGVPCRQPGGQSAIQHGYPAVAHGADAVQYFQWRKSRGSVEKFHGAVVDHVGHLDTRVGREVCRLGEILGKLSPVVGTRVEARVAIIFDWESRWAMDDAQGPRNIGLEYEKTVAEHYRPFWEKGISVDIINADCAFSDYQLVIAPMLYMVRDGFAQKVEAFVAQGGQFVATYWSGIVNESDLCYTDRTPRSRARENPHEPQWGRQCAQTRPDY